MFWLENQWCATAKGLVFSHTIENRRNDFMSFFFPSYGIWWTSSRCSMGRSTAFIFSSTISESVSGAVGVTTYFYIFIKINNNMIFTNLKIIRLTTWICSKSNLIRYWGGKNLKLFNCSTQTLSRHFLSGTMNGSGCLDALQYKSAVICCISSSL